MMIALAIVIALPILFLFLVGPDLSDKHPAVTPGALPPLRGYTSAPAVSFSSDGPLRITNGGSGTTGPIGTTIEVNLSSDDIVELTGNRLIDRALKEILKRGR